MLGLAPISGAPLIAPLADRPSGGLNDLITAAWHLDEGSLPFTDAIGVRHFTIETSTTSAAARQNNGRVYNANTDLLAQNDHADLTPGGDFSWGVWVNYTTSGWLLAKWSPDTASEREYRLRLIAGVPTFGVGDGSGETQVEWSGSISTGDWHLILVRYDATEETIGISVDGGAFLDEPFTGAIPDSSEALYLGVQPAVAESVIGTVDEVMLFDGTALSDAQAAELWNSGDGSFYPFVAGFTATAALTVGAATLSGTAEFDAPVYTGTASLAAPAATLSGTALYNPATGTAGLTVAAAMLAGDATFAPGTKTAAAALIVGAATLAGTGVVPATATAALIVGAATFAGVAYARLPRAYLSRFLYTITDTIRETISGPGFGTATIVHNGFSIAQQRFGPTTSPAMSQCSYSTQTIAGGGSTEVDLSDLPGTQWPVDARNRSLRYLFVRNRGTGTLAIGPAASTPIEPFGAGNTPVFPAGATISLFLPGGIAVSDSAKLLKLTGTAADESDVAILVG